MPSALPYSHLVTVDYYEGGLNSFYMWFLEIAMGAKKNLLFKSCINKHIKKRTIKNNRSFKIYNFYPYFFKKSGISSIFQLLDSLLAGFALWL